MSINYIANIRLKLYLSLSWCSWRHEITAIGISGLPNEFPRWIHGRRVPGDGSIAYFHVEYPMRNLSSNTKYSHPHPHIITILITVTRHSLRDINPYTQLLPSRHGWCWQLGAYGEPTHRRSSLRPAPIGIQAVRMKWMHQRNAP